MARFIGEKSGSSPAVNGVTDRHESIRPLRPKTLGNGNSWREHCRARAAEHLAMAARAASSISEVARSLGVTQGRVSHWCSPENSATISYADILAMPAAVGRLVMYAGLVFMEEREREGATEGASSTAVDVLARNTTVAHGRTIETLHLALADGEIDATDAAAILRAAREERARLEALERQVIAAASAAREETRKLA